MIYDVVDLDGTYCRGNTLHIYIREGLLYNLKRLNLWRVARILAFSMSRACRLCSHRAFKFGALDAAGDDDRLMNAFARRVNALVNEDVAARIDRSRRQGHIVLLATAAPDFYVRHIWKGEYVATPWHPGEKYATECRGEEKLRRVLEFTGGVAPTLVITDDTRDDAPIIASAKEAVIIN